MDNKKFYDIKKAGLARNIRKYISISNKRFYWCSY